MHMPKRPNSNMNFQLRYSCITLLIPLLALIMSDFSVVNVGPIMSINANSIINPQCFNQTCGSIGNISYPFGLASNPECPVFNPFFNLTCNQSTGKLYLFQDLKFHGVNYTSKQVSSIQTESLVLNMTKQSNIYLFIKNSTNQCERQYNKFIWHKFAPVGVGPYVLANDNVFGSFGSALGFIYTSNIVEKNNTRLYLSGGAAVGGCAVQLPDNANNPQCRHRNCCISEIPTRASNSSTSFSPRFFYISITNSPLINDSTNIIPPLPCDQSYAAVFHPDYTDFQYTFGVKLNWAIPLPSNFTNITDTTAIMKSHDYVCATNDTGGVNLTVVPEIHGYRCSCFPGYTGDGYANGTGCTDVNECDANHDCITSKATCVNFNGSYACKCNSIFFDGDGKRNETGCKISQTTIRAISISGGVIGVGVIVCIIIFAIKWWKSKTKKYHFLQNGGLQLQEFMRSRGRETLRLFSEVELRNATNNYSDTNKIGVGGFGAVFIGMLEDGRNIAIKKAKHGDGDNQQFLNEMDILTQINHRHIVKVLGCCLETPTPLLVYEYVCNGSLAENLHRKRDGTIMTWIERLTIAKQVAEALAYLHGDISPPVFHRDVKPGNILLDDKWNAKVADFGVSRLLPDGNQHVSTVVQGTLGYLDPEYFQTLQLTDKSDVYSFGVVLVELFTCLKPVDNQNRTPEFCNLAILFMHHMKMETLDEIIDPNLEVSDSLKTPIDGFKIKSSIMAIASLAYACLSLDGNERPTMRDVAIKLQQIFQSFIYTLDNQSEDTLPLLPLEAKMEKYYAMVNVTNPNEQSELGSYSLSMEALNVTTIAR